MFNRLKKFAPLPNYAYRSISSKMQVHTDNDGRTQLHIDLPTFQHPDQLNQYIKKHGIDHVVRELHTVSNHGLLPISSLSADSPIFKACTKFYNPTAGILPPSTRSQARPNHDQAHYFDYENLFNAANMIINYTRGVITRSPHQPWMQPSSAEALAIHENEQQIVFALSLCMNSTEQEKSYAFRYASLCEEQGSGTSKAFAYAGLKALARSTSFGPIEASAYSIGHENHHLLIINDIFYSGHAVVCDPWAGQVYTTTEMNSQCRIPSVLTPDPSKSAMVYYNPAYHTLKPLQRAPTHAGELATTSRNPSSLFKQAWREVQNRVELQRVHETIQSTGKNR